MNECESCGLEVPQCRMENVRHFSSKRLISLCAECADRLTSEQRLKYMLRLMEEN